MNILEIKEKAMGILNLKDVNNGHIAYSISRFPDGQQQVKIDSDSIEADEIITIKSRLNNFGDLELIICAVKSLKGLGVNEIHLYVPYFLGSRSDRRFEEGSNNYLKDVICPVINSLGLHSVTVINPHSNILEACIDNFKKLDNEKLLGFVFKTLYGESLIYNSFFISPDSGASKKIYKLAEKTKYDGEIIACSKSRDIYGKLSNVVVPLGNIINSKKDAILIDDICDGGRTFINIAKVMKDADFGGRIFLVVTHGIFSAGFDELGKYFDGIYCTNSYSDITHPLIHQLDIW